MYPYSNAYAEAFAFAVENVPVTIDKIKSLVFKYPTAKANASAYALL